MSPTAIRDDALLGGRKFRKPVDEWDIRSIYGRENTYTFEVILIFR